MTRFLNVLYELTIRNFVRFAFRRLNVIRFLLKQAKDGGSVHLGTSVVISNPQCINCGENVSIGNSAELLIDDDKSYIYLGNSVKIGKRSQLAANPGKIEIGDFASIHTGTYLLGNIYVGRYSILSVNIFASSGDHHPFDIPHLLIRDQDIIAQKNLKKTGDNAVVIEEDCWIGWGAVIKKNVHIGRGAIVGAGAVITKDVAPYSVMAGQPARKIKARLCFAPPKIIQANLPEHIPYFYRGFIQLQSEKDKLGSGLNGYVAALQEAILVMSKDDTATYVKLEGITLAKNVVLYARCGYSAKQIILPKNSNTKFDVIFDFSANDKIPEFVNKKPEPRVLDCKIISIYSLQSKALDIETNRQSPLWAIHSSALIS
jgi:acetyltransferase-like isoleucine patch superfamily enzyme